LGYFLARTILGSAQDVRDSHGLSQSPERLNPFFAVFLGQGISTPHRQIPQDKPAKPSPQTKVRPADDALANYS
jgi:hypothetical protein